MIDMDLTSTNTDIGLHDGSFCWISGSTSTLGTLTVSGDNIPANPHLESTYQFDWTTGFLIDESLGSIVLRCDLTGLGTYGEASPMSFSVINTSLFSDTIFTTYEGKIYKRPIRFYAVSDDGGGTPYTFVQVWAGIVDSTSFTETEFTFNCIDDIEALQGKFPPINLDKTNYPLIESDWDGNPLPVCIGKVTYAKLAGIEGGATSINIFTNGYGSHKITRIPGDSTTYIINGTEFLILTGSVVFIADELVDKWLNCLEVGPDTSKKIISNYASSGGFTRIKIQEAFKVDDKEAKPTSKWWFEVVDPGINRAVSQNPIYVFELNASSGFPDVKTWDDTFKKYMSGYGAIKGFYRNGLPKYFPTSGVQLAISNPSDGGEATSKWVSYLKPSSITLKEIVLSNPFNISDPPFTPLSGTIDSNDFPAVDADCPYLYDRDKTTKYTIAYTPITPYASSLKITLDLGLAFEDFQELINTLKVGFRAKLSMSGSTDSILVSCQGSLKIVDITTAVGDVLSGTDSQDPDFYASLINQFHVAGSSINTSAPSIEMNYINDRYFSLTGDGDDIDQNNPGKDGYWMFGFDFSNIKTVQKIHSLRLVLNFICVEYDPTPLSMAPMPGTYDPVTYSIFNNSLGDASLSLELSEITVIKSFQAPAKAGDLYLKLQGEKFTSTWGSRRTLNNPVLNIVDAMEFIIRQYYSASAFIDTASFDALNSSSIQVGKQILEQKTAFEHLEEMLQGANYVLTPLHNGKKYLRDWTAGSGLDAWVIDESLILPGSLSPMTDVDLYKCYSEFIFNFDYSPATDKYNRQIFIKKTDQATFPAETDLDGTEYTFDMTVYAYTGYSNYSDGSDGKIVIWFAELLTPFLNGRFKLTGGHGGLAFDVTIADGIGFGETDGNNFVIINTGSPTGLSGSTVYQDGVLTYWKTNVVKWKTYVGGVEDYTFADSLWEPVRAARALTKINQTLTMDMPWFPDFVADWSAPDETAVAPFNIIQSIAAWLAKPKKILTCQVPISSTTLAFEVGQSGFFQDQKLSPINRFAWIQTITLNTQDNVFELELLIDLWDTPD